MFQVRFIPGIGSLPVKHLRNLVFRLRQIFAYKFHHQANTEIKIFFSWNTEIPFFIIDILRKLFNIIGSLGVGIDFSGLPVQVRHTVEPVRVCNRITILQIFIFIVIIDFSRSGSQRYRKIGNLIGR